MPISTITDPLKLISLNLLIRDINSRLRRLPSTPVYGSLVRDRKTVSIATLDPQSCFQPYIKQNKKNCTHIKCRGKHVIGGGGVVGRRSMLWKSGYLSRGVAIQSAIWRQPLLCWTFDPLPSRLNYIIWTALNKRSDNVFQIFDRDIHYLSTNLQCRSRSIKK